MRDDDDDDDDGKVPFVNSGVCVSLFDQYQTIFILKS